MCYISFPNEDIEEFSKYLGLTGSDADLFYESYYNLTEDEDEDLMWEETIKDQVGG